MNKIIFEFDEKLTKNTKDLAKEYNLSNADLVRKAIALLKLISDINTKSRIKTIQIVCDDKTYDLKSLL